jgi:predicted nucleic acid-binding protein
MANGSVEISTMSPTGASNHVGEVRSAQGVLDTSVVIDLEALDSNLGPAEVAVTALTMAELAAGPHAAHDGAERARRQDRLQRTEAIFAPLPFDAEAARVRAHLRSGDRRRPNGTRRRAVDLMIAALGGLVEVVAI